MKGTRTTGNPIKPAIVGTGLIALDVVVNTASAVEPQIFTGGTCGNVMTILSYLGWHSVPVSRLRNDSIAKLLVDDLTVWGVDTSHVSRTRDGSTPVIFETIRELTDGTRTHSFSTRCPCCGDYLPGYKSILGNSTAETASLLRNHQVYFFDRATRGTINLAKASAAQGSLVFFEPSGLGEPRLFEEAWSLSHIVKYSNERLRDIADIGLGTQSNENVILEIETLGASGLRYRSKLKSGHLSGWKMLGVIPARMVKDTAGSGDWCTAGLINKLGRGGLVSLKKISNDRLKEAFRYAQALATWNCGFDGARGGMYRVTKVQFDRQVKRLLEGKMIHEVFDEPKSLPEDARKVCPSCESVDFSKRKISRRRSVS